MKTVATPARYLGKQLRRGFSLFEILIATTISSFVMAGIVSVFMQGLRIYHYDSKKITINRQIRDFTAELTANATFANYALIYPNFQTRRNTVEGSYDLVHSDESETETHVEEVEVLSEVSQHVRDGGSGDMLVLVYVNPMNDREINRIVGYYRAPVDPANRNSLGPVRKFDRTFNPPSTALAVDLLPAIDTYQSGEIVIELSEGLSDGRLFHNFRGRSVMINGEIVQDGGAGSRVATNTYNFTISPRG